MTPEELEALAASPQSASADGRAATSRSADDIIKLENYAAQKRAKTARSTGIRFFKITKGSNVGDDSAGGCE